MNTGTIKQIIGPVVDVEFTGELPEILNALQVERDSTPSPQSSPAGRGGLSENSSPRNGGEGVSSQFSSPRGRGEGEGRYSYDYLFEPSPTEVLDGMLPRLVEVQVYQAILESSASEHSARMVAMKSASDAARDMIDDLTFTFNQARQATITREIAEISAGKAALE